MKLKFRASSKDIMVFGIFTFVLLYLVSIAVVNFSFYRENQEFSGFNPIPAFTTELFPPTMVIFLGILIGIISSVKNYFFDLEKGIGVSTKKKEESGYSRWSTDKEMKEVLKKILPNENNSSYAGVPLINNGKEIWVDDGEFHNLIIGSTGSGKTQTMVNPLVKILAKKGESMIVTDPKGEIYEENVEMLKSKGYNVIVLNFRDPQRGNAWNPLYLPYSLHREGNKDKANELLDDLAMNILYDEKSSSQDPFWERTSADYFAGLSLGMFDDAAPEEINLNSINLMTTVGEEKYLGNTYINEYFSDKDKASSAYVNVASTLMAAKETKGSILSVFKQKIKLFSSRENLSEMLSHNDFDMKDIGRQKTAVFIVIQDEKKTYHSLVTIFIKQCYETLIDVAHENGGKLPFRTNFILDEFANMPPLKDVTTMVTAARSRAIRFSFIIQNFAQLYQVYGKENGETIKGNCGNIIYLISSELSALEEISKMAGEVKSKDKEKTASKPLVTVSDLQRLPQWQTIVLRTRKMPFKTKLTPNYKMDWGETFGKGGYPTREKTAIKMFDLKKFVEDKRKALFQETANILGDDSSKSLFNPDMMFGGPNKSGSGNPAGFPFDMNEDEMLKRINERIAELEAEEARYQAEANGKLPDVVEENPQPITMQPVTYEVEDDVNVNVTFEHPEMETMKQPIPFHEVSTQVSEPIKTEEKSKQSYLAVGSSKGKPTSTSQITDDQFFDDFFFDEEE